MGTTAPMLPLQLVARVVTSQTGPTPLVLVCPQPSIMSATMIRTSRSLRRPWRPSQSPSAARECGGGEGWQRVGTHVPLDACPLPCSVSEFLMGEVDSSILLSVPPGDPGQVSRDGLGAARGQAGRADEYPLPALWTVVSRSVQGGQ